MSQNFLANAGAQVEVSNILYQERYQAFYYVHQKNLQKQLYNNSTNKSTTKTNQFHKTKNLHIG